ncbi:MAG: DUF805 domain-containing protein [Lachnospiraceae bacterium]|nr:DUF805 domain-containing protein [Lachnospiraceae bacterium]
MKNYAAMWEHAFDFKGRTNKADFMSALGINLIFLVIILFLISVVIQNDDNVIGIVLLLPATYYCMMMIIPFAAMIIRRYHDAGYSAGMYVFSALTSFIVIGWIAFIIIVKKDSAPDNKWGPQNPEGNSFDFPVEPRDGIVDRRINESELPPKKKWPKNVLILFLISLACSGLIELISWIFSEIIII